MEGISYTIAVFSVFVAVAGGTDLIVQTKYGKLVGQRLPKLVNLNSDIEGVDQFLGIPYAAPPVGRLRFQPPKPPVPWDGIRQCKVHGNNCPQPIVGLLDQPNQTFGEDCLFLNVYSPYKCSRGDTHVVSKLLATKWLANFCEAYIANICSQGYIASRIDHVQCSVQSAVELCLPKDYNITASINFPMRSIFKRRTKYPVMVYIHGGSYVRGSGNVFNGYALAHKDVVVVTITYRLGFLGFFTTTTSAALGNYGLQDQTQALKWVQENISSFRGHPRKVTIFGNSAGGASVGLHLVMPASRGLFHGAIIQSGSPLAAYAYNNKSSEVHVAAYADDIIAKFGCAQKFVNESIQCLRLVAYEPLKKYADSLPLFNPLLLRDLNYIPWIDGIVLPDSPPNLFDRGPVNQVPVIIGTVTAETEGFSHTFLSRMMGQDSMRYEMEHSHLQQAIQVFVTRFGYPRIVSEAAIQEYSSGTKDNDKRENHQTYVKFTADKMFLVPAVSLARKLTRRKIPVYQYLFDGTMPDREENKYSKGTPHEGELNHLFGAPFTGKKVSQTYGKTYPYNNQDRNLSDRVMTLWANFAKYKIPKAVSGSNITTAWQRYQLDTGDYLYIDVNKCQMKTNLRKEKMDFWIDEVPRLIQSCQNYSLGITGVEHYNITDPCVAFSNVNVRAASVINVMFALEILFNVF